MHWYTFTRYYFLLLGRTGLHDRNVHSTFSHCDLRTFGASEEIVTSGEVGFVLLIVTVETRHCGLESFNSLMYPAQLALRCAWTLLAISILVSQRKARAPQTAHRLGANSPGTASTGLEQLLQRSCQFYALPCL